MKTIAAGLLAVLLFAAVAVAGPAQAPKPGLKIGEHHPESGTLADPEVIALVTRMNDKVNEMMAAGRELISENARLERENAWLKSKLGCS